MRVISANLVCAVGILLACPALAADSAGATTDRDSQAASLSDSPWQFSIRPYFFLSGVSGSVTASGQTIPINSTFGDLLGNLRPSGFLTFSAEKAPWGVYADLQYINLAGEGGHALEAELSLKNTIAELDVTFRPPAAQTLKFFVGARVYAIDQGLTIGSQPEAKARTTVVDPILGATGSWSLNDSWKFEVRGDIGGFGVGSEFTYQMMALFHVNLSKTLALPFGYRVLGYEVNTGGVLMNVLMSGVVPGLDVGL